MPSDAASAQSILIIEDDDDIRDTLIRLLRDEGYETAACANGLEALERLRLGHRADVILLDLMMPIMDGWEFRVQQKADPRIASIPVLAISADTSAKAAAIDAEAYLRKPIDYETLVGSVERTIVASERRRLQAKMVETERLVALGTLAAGVAHEINNPLAYVMANRDYVALALDRGEPLRYEPLRDALSEMRDGCERIRTIVQDLRLLSRASDEEEIGVDVRRVLDSSANIVMNEIRRRARLTRDYEEVPTIRASAPRLGQVFLNLILNAAQAIPEGRAGQNEIRLTTRVTGEDVIVEVRDTGTGIPAEVRGRIFDPFFTTKDVGSGTGLGLSISHNIIRNLGGEISVESTPGAGTTFRVRLPVARGGAERSLPSHIRPAAGRARILIIDDEPMIGAMVVRVLGDRHRVEAVTNPDAAIARIARGERFDAILCDMMMPEQSGADVHAAIEKLAPDQAHHMIFLTGGAASERAAAFLAEPGRIVIDKPFSLEGLEERVDRALVAFATEN
jgi:signal transduction histidine kinase